MNQEDYYRLGVVVRTHGIKGNLIALVDADNPVRYKKLKAVFLKKGSLFISVNVESVSVKGNTLNLHLENINTIDEAENYIKTELFLPLSQLPPLGKKQVYFHEAVGMKVTDIHEGELGILLQVLDMPEQPIAVVDMNGKELLFPLISEFIEEVDRANNILKVNLPEGLTGIYR